MHYVGYISPYLTFGHSDKIAYTLLSGLYTVGGGFRHSVGTSKYNTFKGRALIMHHLESYFCPVNVTITLF